MPNRALILLGFKLRHYHILTFRTEKRINHVFQKLVPELMARLRTIRPVVSMIPRRVATPSREELERDYDRARREDSEYRKWYKTARWQRLRRQVLERDGYICCQTGVLLTGKAPAPDSPVVDHIVPHRGNADLFWNIDNLQAVSKSWHDSVKQSQEKRDA